MSRLTLPEHRERFRWLHKPPRWQLNDALKLTTAPDTDYWQRTHYGFQRDNGHFFSTSASRPGASAWKSSRCATGGRGWTWG